MSILSQITPNQQERLEFKRITAEFLKLLNGKLTDARAVLGGSGAKDTWLAGNHDIDVFVLFDYKKFHLKSNELSDFLEKKLQRAFPSANLSRVHGSRDYFQMHYGNFFFEIIPILKISKAEQAVNITDVSLLHAKWVNAKAKKLKDEIRLAKQFCRAQQVYGAESYIGGFSGYVLEILIVNYGSFNKLLQASAQWKNKEVVDVEHHYRGKDALFEINSSKHSPLVVIDPVDKSRNAAAALTMEKISLFKKKAVQYLKKPGDSFFIKQEMSIDSWKQKYPQQIVLQVQVLEISGKRDVVGSKLLKAFVFLCDKLKQFGLIDAGWEWNQFYFVLKQQELDEFTERVGPPLKMKEDVLNFKKKNKETYLKGGKIFAKVKIKNRQLDLVLKDLIKEPYFKEKVKEVKDWKIV